jgi:hypothetical protein
LFSQAVVGQAESPHGGIIEISHHKYVMLSPNVRRQGWPPSMAAVMVAACLLSITIP